jgi:cell division protease FtsH
VFNKDIQIIGNNQERKQDKEEILDMITRELSSISRITRLEVQDRMKQMAQVRFDDSAQPFQINADDGPLPRNNQLSYQPVDVYPTPLHQY